MSFVNDRIFFSVPAERDPALSASHILRVVHHLRDGRSPDPPLRNIDDPCRRHVIDRIVDGLQIGEDILDLFSGVEIHPADKLVRDIQEDTLFLEQTGLGVRAVEHRKIFEVPFSVPHASADLRGDVLRLVKSAVIALKADVLSLSVLCPEAFCLPPPVIPDHFICRVQYILRRAVILLELNDLRIRKDLFKIQDIFDVGPAETINALVVVADNTEVPVLFRQKAYKTELGRIGILILIHHDVFETLPIDLQDIRMLLKEQRARRSS